MWSRKDLPSLGNSAGLKYQIYFCSTEHPKYSAVTISYHKLSIAWLSLGIRLKNKSLFDHLKETLNCYEVSFSHEESGQITIYIDQDSCKKAYNLLGLSEKCFLDALNDISRFVIPAERCVPWGSSTTSFFPTRATLTGPIMDYLDQEKFTRIAHPDIPVQEAIEVKLIQETVQSTLPAEGSKPNVVATGATIASTSSSSANSSSSTERGTTSTNSDTSQEWSILELGARLNELGSTLELTSADALITRSSSSLSPVPDSDSSQSVFRVKKIR